MFTFFTMLHVIICIALIMIVLLQTGKGADMGAAFGGATQTVFGSSGPAGFLNKLTTAVAVLFMITSLTLCYFSGRLPTPTIMEQTVEKTAVQTGETDKAVEEKLPAPEKQSETQPEGLPK